MDFIKRVFGYESPETIDDSQKEDMLAEAGERLRSGFDEKKTLEAIQSPELPAPAGGGAAATGAKAIETNQSLREKLLDLHQQGNLVNALRKKTLEELHTLEEAFKQHPQEPQGSSQTPEQRISYEVHGVIQKAMEANERLEQELARSTRDVNWGAIHQAIRDGANPDMPVPRNSFDEGAPLIKFALGDGVKNLDKVRFLLEYGVDPSSTYSYRMSGYEMTYNPITDAVLNERTEVLSLFRFYGTRFTNKLAELAASSNRYSSLMWLLEHDIKPSPTFRCPENYSSHPNMTVVQVALDIGDRKLLELVLPKEAVNINASFPPDHPRYPDATLLEAATIQNDLATVQMLERVGSKPVRPEKLEELRQRPIVSASERRSVSNLRVFDGRSIPPDTNILLCAPVFDGVGDLEHVIHAAKALKRFIDREGSQSQVFIYLKRGNKVPDSAWREKLAVLKSLDFPMYVSEENPTDDQIASIRSQVQSLEQAKTCRIDVSARAESPQILDSFDSMGLVPEYRTTGAFGLPGSDSSSIMTGLDQRTAGLWLNRAEGTLSEPARRQLFGTDTPGTVGFASLRSDRGRLWWMECQLHSMPRDQNCTLAVSPFRETADWQTHVRDLAQRHGFAKCVVRNREGREETIFDGLPGAENSSRTLRIVHEFIAESDMDAVRALAQEGVLGAAGDTAFANGLLGKYPPLVENRHFKTLVDSNYLVDKNYPLLRRWFGAYRVNPPSGSTPLPSPFTPELMEEWERFQRVEIPRLDLTPWFERFVVRCAYIKRFPALKELEERYMSKQIELEEYRAQVASLVDQAVAGGGAAAA